MCRTGGRRCAGSGGRTKATLRKRISRARKAIQAGRDAGDDVAIRRAEEKLAAAREELTAAHIEHRPPNRDNTSQAGDVTNPHDDQPATHNTSDTTDNNSAGNRDDQPVIITGDVYVDTFHAGTTFYTTSEGSDGQRTVITRNENHGIQAAVINGNVVFARRRRDTSTDVPPSKPPAPPRDVTIPPAEPYVPRERTEPRPSAVKGDHTEAVAEAAAAYDALRRFQQLRSKFPRAGR